MIMHLRSLKSLLLQRTELVIFDLPLMTPADLQNDNKIDYSDLSILAESLA